MKDGQPAGWVQYSGLSTPIIVIISVSGSVSLYIDVVVATPDSFPTLTHIIITVGPKTVPMQ